MLISINIRNKKKSKYKCDRCNKELSGENKIKVMVGLPNNESKKICDLCPRCYSMLVKGIRKQERPREVIYRWE